MSGLCARPTFPLHHFLVFFFPGLFFQSSEAGGVRSVCIHLVYTDRGWMSSGIPAWIRTKNEGVKGLSVTVTPRGYCVQSTPAVLPSLDSNQDKQLQRLRCYRYTTGEYAFRVRLLLTEQLLVLFRPLNRCPLKTDGSNCPTGHTTNNDASTFHRLIICLSLFLEHETSLAQPTRKPGSVLDCHLSQPPTRSS